MKLTLLWGEGLVSRADRSKLGTLVSVRCCGKRSIGRVKGWQRGAKAGRGIETGQSGQASLRSEQRPEVKEGISG